MQEDRIRKEDTMQIRAFHPGDEPAVVALWEELRIPVDMAFFFRSTPAGRVVAFYN